MKGAAVSQQKHMGLCGGECLLWQDKSWPGGGVHHLTDISSRLWRHQPTRGEGGGGGWKKGGGWGQ